MNAKKRFIADSFRMSEESLTDGWSMPYAHYHDAYEIYILESGERTVTIGETEYTARKYDATLFAAQMTHKSRGNVPFSGICIHFTTRFLGAYFTDSAAEKLMKCFQYNVIRLDDEGFGYIKKAAAEFKQEAADNFLILANILNILCRSGGAEDAAVIKKQSKKPRKSQLIIDYVNENYFYIKKVSDITERFSVSENYVFKIFREKYGVTPKQHINSLRIKNACHRLYYTERTVREIAVESGFESYERFYAVFKKIMNITPTEYRSKIHSEAKEQA